MTHPTIANPDLSKPFNWDLFEPCGDDECDFCDGSSLEQSNHFAVNVAVAALHRVKAEMVHRRTNDVCSPGMDEAIRIIDRLLETKP